MLRRAMLGLARVGSGASATTAIITPASLETNGEEDNAVDIALSDYLQEAVQLGAVHKWQEAIDYIEGPLEEEGITAPQTNIQSSAFVFLGTAYRELGEHKRAIEVLSAAAESEKVKEPGVSKLMALLGIAKSYRALQEYPKSTEQFLAALRYIADTDPERYQKHKCAVHAELANVFLDTKQFAMARQHFQQASPIAVKLGNMHMAAMTMEGQAKSFILQGQFEDGLAVLVEALKVAEATKDSRQIAAIKYQMGSAYLQTRQYAEAIKVLQESLSGLTDPREAWMANIGIASAYQRLDAGDDKSERNKNNRTAERHLVTAVEIVSNKFEDLPSEVSTRIRLASHYRDVGRHEEAIEHYKAALRVAEQAKFESGMHGAKLHLALEYAKIKKERPKAEQLLTEVNAATKDVAMKKNCISGLAEVYHYTGQIDKAISVLEEGLELGKLPDAPPGTLNEVRGLFGSQLAHSYARKGEYLKAAETYDLVRGAAGDASQLAGVFSSCLSAGNLYRTLGQTAKAEERLREALSVATNFTDESYPTASLALSSLLVEQYTNESRPGQSSPGKESTTEAPAETSKTTTTSATPSPAAEMAQSKTPEEKIEEAISLYKNTVDNVNSDSIKCKAMVGLGVALHATKKEQEALSKLKEAHSLAKKKSITEIEGMILSNMSVVLISLGQPDEAKSVLEAGIKAAKSRASNEAESIQTILPLLLGLAEVEASKQDFDAARQIYQQVFDKASQYSMWEFATTAQRRVANLEDAAMDEMMKTQLKEMKGVEPKAQ